MCIYLCVLYVVYSLSQSSLQVRERKAMKPRAGMKPSFPMLRPVGKTKEQFIQSLAGSDPLRLLANSVPHGYYYY